ncbi:Uncharacterised protein [Bordetella pertussis]|nr:Uncharacterised protein [Bordetella pertussis]
MAAAPLSVAVRAVAKLAVAARLLPLSATSPAPRLASRATRSVPASTTVPPA